MGTSEKGLIGKVLGLMRRPRWPWQGARVPVAVYMVDRQWKRVCDVCFYATYQQAEKAIHERIDGFLQACQFMQLSRVEMSKKYMGREHEFYIEKNGVRVYDGSDYFLLKKQAMYPSQDTLVPGLSKSFGSKTLVHPIHRSSNGKVPVRPSWPVPKRA